MNSLFKHCREKHVDPAEYRKRIFWQADRNGFLPLHLTYSIPGSLGLRWHHPDAMAVARPRCEVACVVCARKDWLENRHSVYLWREADGRTTLSELQHIKSGDSELLTCGEHLCFGNRHKINELLAPGKYAELMPLKYAELKPTPR